MDTIKEAIIEALENAFEKMCGEKVEIDEVAIKEELEVLKDKLGIHNREFENMVIRKDEYHYAYRTSKNFIEKKYVEALKIFGENEDILVSAIHYYDENNSLIKTDYTKYIQSHK